MKLNSLFGNVKNLLDGGKKEEAKKALMDAFNKAAEDGDITPEEMATINQLQKDTGVSEDEFNEIKIKVLQLLMDKITQDGNVSEEELKMFNTIKGDLNIQSIEEDLNKPENKGNPDIMKKSISTLISFYGKAKETTLKGVKTIGDKIQDTLKKDDPKNPQ